MKKVLTLVLSLALITTLAVTGTIAYLQDTDEAVNVMTLGNVDIEQIEQEWNADQDALQEFTQLKPLYPYVGELGWDNEDENDGAYRRFTMNNVVDKYVSVKNNGRSDAYVRTIFAFEMGEYASIEEWRNNIVGFSRNVIDGDEFDFPGAWEWDDLFVTEIDGQNYAIWTATHANALASGETTIPSLLQVYMNKNCGNAEVEKVDGNKNGTYDILVISQAVQTAGFEIKPTESASPEGISLESAKNALNTAFGDITATNHPWVGVQIKWPSVLYSSDDAFTASKESGSYTLGGDYKTSEGSEHYSANREYAIRDGNEFTLELNGHTIAHDTEYNGMTYLFTVAYNGTLTVNGEGTIESNNQSDGANAESAIFYAQSTGTIIINSGTYNPTNGIGAWAGNGAHITINGGYFESHGEKQCELIYSSGGIIDIYGGFFHNTAWEGRPVNVANANRGTGFINIYGGTFVNFDPSTGGDDPNNILVADGYKVVSETQANGDVWYTVVPE